MKRPAFQFYPADWLNDIKLQTCSLGAQGLLVNLMCLMHQSEKYGYLLINGLNPPDKDVSHLLRLHHKTYQARLIELLLYGVLCKDESGVIFCKRMVKDEYLREIRSIAGKLGGSPLLKQKVKRGSKQKPTPSTSSSSSTSKTKDIKRFIVPSLGEIKDYCKERKNQVNPQIFIDHYTSNGWMVGKNKMKDWKASVRTWEQRNYGGTPMDMPKKEKPFVKCPKCGELKYTELIEYRKGVFLCPDCLKDADPEIPDKLKELMSKIGGV